MKLSDQYRSQLKITKFSFASKNNPDFNDQSCSVCLMKYQPNDEVVHLPCNHIYHPECVFQWFNLHTTCPICKKDVRDNFQIDEKLLSTSSSQLELENYNNRRSNYPLSNITDNWEEEINHYLDQLYIGEQPLISINEILNAQLQLYSEQPL